ncbi:MAG: hypothetical protein H0W83_08015 [Planctomycetes bacterium]|nr:hypothetical protein [Planctomycetota bacterium]
MPCPSRFARSRSLAVPIALVASAIFAATGSAATTAETNAPSQEYLDAKAELESMLNSRDMELFELSFEPISMDRVVLPDRSGKERVYNYLAFRIRNQVADRSSKPLSQAKGYNDVLEAISKQYEIAKKVEGNGTRLDIEGIESKEGVENNDATIVKRMDAQTHKKKLSITVLGYDENGTRLRLLDEPAGSGPQESFNFPDTGDTTRSAIMDKVKDKIEEKEGRELYTLDKIRSIELPPYDAVKRQENGWAEGELYGVAMFNKLTDYGDYFTFEVRGLSNKLRIRWPDTETGKVENYLDMRVFRRVFVLHYDRVGDEYFRELDPFKMTKGGWEWVNTFQRNDERRNMAYARYFLNNITSDNDPEQKPNAAVEAELWEYYNEVRAQRPDKSDKLPDLEQILKR